MGAPSVLNQISAVSQAGIRVSTTLTSNEEKPMPSKRYVQWVICTVACITSVLGHAQDPNKKRVQKTNWQSLYQPAQFDQLPLRVMPPIQIESGKKYPLILSLHGAGGTGTDNNKQLRDWNKQLALPQRRKAFPCYVIAPQAQGLWNNVHLNKI